MVVIFLIFAICCIHFDSVSGSDDRISRLEKLVEAHNVMILGLKKAFDTQNIKIDRLEKQLQSCKACFDFKRSNNTSSLLSHQILTSRNEKNLDTPIDITGGPKQQNAKSLSKNYIYYYRLSTKSKKIRNPSTDINKSTIDEEFDAFHAYLSKPEKDPGHHHTIIFDTVLANSGNGYNNHTGSFIAPVDGVYVFAFSVTGIPGSRMPVQLVVNSNIVGAVAADSQSDTPNPSASTVVIVHLNQDDTCLLRTATNTRWVVGSLYSRFDWSRCSFSGWKL
ncbi:unnamed protein product [Mytilus coruscus]|uniref:C1q domain-containing protein n=1 Tax=Mytilus coruscus TaxID=42192 RepID=A0A6J8BLF5_MYTCO|nr:unnamed protein product [Mytilus coruscus]